MPKTEILEVRNDLAEVERVNAALGELWASRGLPEDLEVPVTLALEEVLSNVIRHGCERGREYSIRVRFTVEANAFEFEVTDNGRKFNPLDLPPPDVRAPLDKRRPGGLGVFLVKQLADEVRYEHRDGQNHMLFRKRFPAAG